MSTSSVSASSFSEEPQTKKLPSSSSELMGPLLKKACSSSDWKPQIRKLPSLSSELISPLLKKTSSSDENPQSIMPPSSEKLSSGITLCRCRRGCCWKSCFSFRLRLELQESYFFKDSTEIMNNFCRRQEIK